MASALHIQNGPFVSWEKNNSGNKIGYPPSTKPWGIKVQIILISHIDQPCSLIRKLVCVNGKECGIHGTKSSMCPRKLRLRCILLGLWETDNAFYFYFYFYVNYVGSFCNKFYQIWDNCYKCTVSWSSFILAVMQKTAYVSVY